MNKDKTNRESGNRHLADIPLLTGECPTMNRAALGTLRILLGFEQANNYLETVDQSSSQILVTTEIDWSWTRILAHFEGVITNQGTRVSRAAEVLAIMHKPGVLGTKKGTEVLHSGALARIVCDGNEGLVYLVQEDGSGFDLGEHTTRSIK